MDDSDRKIVILGKTGVGKSSVANTILGEERFKTNDTANSETSTCRAETRYVHGRSITLVDTPGFFDTVKSEKELRPEIIRCITECAPGPHAFLILLKVETFTKHEEAAVTQIRKYFSEEVFKYATVLFTHGDDLNEGQTVEEYFQQNQHASDLLKKCGGRCHVIDNKYWKNNQQEEYRSNQFQVKELLETIDETVKANEGSCYTNKMLQAVKEEIQQVEELSESSEVKEVREKVFKYLTSKLKGFATRALLGAFFGVPGLITKVVIAMALRGVSAGAPAAAGAASQIVRKFLQGEAQECNAADSPRKAVKRAGEGLPSRRHLKRKCHKRGSKEKK